MTTKTIEPPHLAADLKTLCLSTVAAQWRPRAEEAVRQRQAPADYLARLVHLEVTGRRERRIQRRIQDARFPDAEDAGRLLVPGAAGPGSRRGEPGGNPEGMTGPRDRIVQVLNNLNFFSNGSNCRTL